MELVLLISSLAGLLLLGLVLKPLASHLRFPFEALLLLLGFAFGSQLVDADQLGLHSGILRDLVFYVFLPVLIFSAAYSMDAPSFGRNLFGIILLAMPLALISLVFATVLIYYGMGHPTGFPWIAALLTGTMLIATHSQALQQVFIHLNLPPDLRTLIRGESLLNNAFAIVLFTLLLAFALEPDLTLGAQEIALYIAWEVLGGAIIGIGIGFFALIFLRVRQPSPHEVALFTLVTAYMAYLVAEYVLNVSGVLSVLATALIMGRTMHQDLDAPQDHFVDEFWRLMATLAESLLFLMLGLSIAVDIFSDRYLAILIGIGAVILARIAGLALVMPLLARTNKALKKLPNHNILYFSNARGAVTIGLALSVPIELEYWWTIESIGFGVVLFSVLIQAPLLELWQQKKMKNKKAVADPADLD